MMAAQRAHLQYLANLLDDDKDDYADQVSCLEPMHLLHIGKVAGDVAHGHGSWQQAECRAHRQQLLQALHMLPPIRGNLM